MEPYGTFHTGMTCQVQVPYGGDTSEEFAILLLEIEWTLIETIKEKMASSGS